MTVFSKVRSKIADIAVSGVIKAIIFMISLRKRDYQKTRDAIQWAFVVKAWTDSRGLVAVDLEDSLLNDLGYAFTYFSLAQNKRRAEVSTVEKAILPYDFSYWVLRDDPIVNHNRAWKIAREHKLVESIRHYRNIQFKSNAIAEEEILAFIRSPDAEQKIYWRRQVNDEVLPEGLRQAKKTKEIRKWAKQNSKSMLRDIGKEKQNKYTLSLGDVATFIALIVALMATLSYLRVWVLFDFFDIPFSDYFSISDYLSNGIAKLDKYLVLLGVAVTCWAYVLSLRSVREHALKKAVLPRNWAELIAEYALDFSYVAAIIVFAVQSYRGIILPLPPFGMAFIWLAGRMLTQTGFLFIFVKPERVLFGLMGLIFIVGIWIEGFSREFREIVLNTKPEHSRSFIF